MVSSAGGIDIEEVAAKTPEKIIRLAGRSHATACCRIRRCRSPSSSTATATRCKRGGEDHGAALHARSWTTARRWPRSIRWSTTPDGEVLALDAKISIDDNELVRRPDLGALRDESAEEPSEAAARRRQPHVHQARRQRRLRRERRRARDGDDGPGEVLRRRAGQLPRHRRLVEPREGGQRAQDHHRRPAREGDPVQHLRRHHAHRRRGERHRDGHAARSRSRCRS